MSKLPEVVLCEVANEDMSHSIVTYLYDLETGLITADGTSVQPSDELASIESCHYDSAGNLVRGVEKESSVDSDRYKFVSREWNAESSPQHNRTTRYDDRKGGWTSLDPLAFAGDDANLYRYLRQPKTEG